MPRIFEMPTVVVAKNWLKLHSHCGQFSLLLACLEHMASLVGERLMKNERVGKSLMHLFKKSLLTWLANNEGVENNEGIFVQVNVDKVVFPAITNGDLNLRLNDLRQVARVGQDEYFVSGTIAGSLFQLHRANAFDSTA